jgi:hypothetical protein
MGVAIDELWGISQSLHEDLGEAILAMPFPLDKTLAILPAKQAEEALLTFTIEAVLASPELGLPRFWATFPKTLLGLFSARSPYIHQIIYLGTLLNHPDDPAKWSRARRVMQRLGHPKALPPWETPYLAFLDEVYETKPGRPHPFPYFHRHPIAPRQREVEP